MPFTSPFIARSDEVCATLLYQPLCHAELNQPSFANSMKTCDLSTGLLIRHSCLNQICLLPPILFDRQPYPKRIVRVLRVKFLPLTRWHIQSSHRLPPTYGPWRSVVLLPCV